MTAERFSLKDHLFNREKVSYLGELLADAIDGFDRQGFERAVMARIPELELKQRIALIAEVLSHHLDPDFDIAAKQIRAALPPPLDPTLTDDDFGDFIFAPFGRFVEEHGIDHYATSMALLRDLTMRFSMEGSVRPFINQRPAETLKLFEIWAADQHYHVRRLVSESTRPRLPWAPRIELDVAAPIPLLDTLHSDPTRYVTRSVANHLNDISKIEPRLAIDSLSRWQQVATQQPAELEWMTRHALRTLVKKGNPEALTLLGYPPDPKVELGLIELTTPIVKAGESLEFSVSITSLDSTRLLVDYIIDFVKKNGGTSPKVFKLRTLSLERDETMTLGKRHPLRSDATTYRLYPGPHRLTVVVNGNEMASTQFEVKTD